MAKQRRARFRPAPSKAKKSSARPRSLQPSAPLPMPQRPPRPAVPPSVPVLRTTYIEAVALYERGLQALQGHDYAGARDVFRSVLSRYPEEKELHERVRLYLNICERQVAPRQSPAPRSVEERLYALSLSIAAGTAQIQRNIVAERVLGLPKERTWTSS